MSLLVDLIRNAVLRDAVGVFGSFGVTSGTGCWGVAVIGLESSEYSTLT